MNQNKYEILHERKDKLSIATNFLSQENDLVFNDYENGIMATTCKSFKMGIVKLKEAIT